MTQGNPSADAWWQDHSDTHQRRALLSVQRSVQRERDGAGWRRNLVLGILTIAFPMLWCLVVAP